MGSLGERLAAVRKEKGWKKSELQRRAGLKSPSTLTELENGTIVHSPQLPEIAECLGVTSYWLKTGRGHKYADEKKNPETKEAHEAQDPILAEAMALLEATDRDGLLMALAAIKFALRDHKPAKAKLAA